MHVSARCYQHALHVIPSSLQFTTSGLRFVLYRPLPIKDHFVYFGEGYGEIAIMCNSCFKNGCTTPRRNLIVITHKPVVSLAL